MALVSFRSHTPRQDGVGNDQRLLMYRFSKSRSKSCTPGRKNNDALRPKTPCEQPQQDIRSRVARENCALRIQAQDLRSTARGNCGPRDLVQDSRQGSRFRTGENGLTRVPRAQVRRRAAFGDSVVVVTSANPGGHVDIGQSNSETIVDLTNNGANEPVTVMNRKMETTAFSRLDMVGFL